jgi:hypothetical protein
MIMRRKETSVSLILVRVVAAVFFLTLSSATAQQLRGRQEFTGTIVGTGGNLGGRTYSFTLTIDRFTADAEASRDAQILRTRGQDAVLDVIRKQKVGTFSLVGQLGRDVNFARVRRMPDGRLRIVAAFERWLNMYEVRYGTRSQDYPFTYIEIYFDENGKGEGTLIPAARISFNRKNQNQLDIENFGIYPARLVGVEWRNRPKVAE